MLTGSLRPLVVGLGAGVVSAVLILSATHGALGLRFALTFLSLQPGMLAGLGWGWPAALVSGAVGVVAIALFDGLREAVIFFSTVAVPVLVLTYLVTLHRRVPSPSSSEGVVEWYPLGRVLAAATLMTAVLAGVLVWLITSDMEATRKSLRTVIEKVFLEPMAGVSDRQLTEEQIVALVDTALYAIPAAAALTWLTSFIFNLWAAGRITLASGRLARPWPDLAATQLPRGFALALVAGLVLTMVPGGVGLWGAGLSGAVVVAYMFVGLAIVHYVTRGSTMRPLILGGLYGALLVLNGWGFLILAMIGLSEPFSPLRRRFDGAPPRQTNG